MEHQVVLLVGLRGGAPLLLLQKAEKHPVAIPGCAELPAVQLVPPDRLLIGWGVPGRRDGFLHIVGHAALLHLKTAGLKPQKGIGRPRLMVQRQAAGAVSYTHLDVYKRQPFNCSTPVVYYNKTVFDAAGVTEFPTTFEGITEAAQQVAESNSSITPVGMYAYGYALDQMVINMGGYVINNENGRADRATEVAYQDQIIQIYNWIKDLQDQGLLLNYGSDETNTISGFTQQQVGMFIASSASCRNVIDSATDFEVGVANLPVPEGTEPEGVYGGGGALCVATGLSEEVEAGVMEFFTYATSPEVQATWAVSTGYFPICNGAYDTDTLKTSYEEMPQLQVAADQLLNSNVNSITAGPLLSQLPQLRTDLQTALEAVFNGSDVESAVAQAVESTNSAIASANQGVAE